MKKHFSTRTKWVLGSVLTVVLLLAGGATAYAWHFSDVALPGVKVAGVPVTGQSQAQIAAAVEQRAADTTVTIDIDGEETVATLDELGIAVDADAMAARALADNVSVISRFTKVFETTEVPVIYTSDPQKVDAFAATLSKGVETEAQNADVELDPGLQTFVATPAVVGLGADASGLEEVAEQAAQTLRSQTVAIEVVQVEPTITTEQAEAVAAKANALLDLEVVLNGTVSTNPASLEEKLAWVTVPKSEEGLGEPVIDAESVAVWVSATAESTNDEPVRGIQNVDSEGNVLSVSAEGQKGYKVNNASVLAEELVAALNAGQGYAGQFQYDEVEPEYDQREVASGSENLVYQAANGEKWIDINLSNNTVTAYEGSRVVQGPTLMVHGMPGAETVTGTYPIYLKYQQQTMRGTRPDGSKYVTEDVPWVMYFHGGYALHGAYWRSSFGYAGPGGSNGCVNIPVEVSRWYYDWTEIGTKVVSHY